MYFKQRSSMVIAALALASVSGTAAADSNTSFGGKVFFDVAHRVDQREGASSAQSSHSGVDIKRLYLELDQRISPVWSLKLVTDFQYSSHDGATDAFIKKAYVEGKFTPTAVLRIGAADTPWMPAVDKAQGFRYVERSIVDRLKFGHSADWGLHLGGSMGQSLPIDYGVSLVNGRGYKRRSKSQGVDVEARIGVRPVKNLQLALGAYTGKPNTDHDAPPALRRANRYNASIAYVGPRTRIGGEVFRSYGWNELAKPVANRAHGWSLWTSHCIGERWTAFARLDRADTAEQTDPLANDQYAHAGLEYQWSDKLQLALVWKDTRREYNGSANGTPQLARRRNKEIGIWGQFAF